MAQREENIVEEELRNADNRMTLFEALEITRVDDGTKISERPNGSPAAQI
jgi:hypothetical protein